MNTKLNNKTSHERPSQSILDAVVKKITNAATSGKEQDKDSLEFDTYVAKMMLEEAQASQEQYSARGISAYLEPETVERGPQLRTNKRFLATIIKRTDAHNEALKKKESDGDIKLRHSKQHREETVQSNQNRSDPSQEKNHEEIPTHDSETCHDIRSSSIAHSTIVTKNVSSPSSPLQHVDAPSSSKKLRGRGHLHSQGSSRLNKMFEKDYDPRLDMLNYDDANLDIYIQNLEDAQSRIKAAKKHKKRKLEKECDSSCSEGSESSKSESKHDQIRKKKSKKDSSRKKKRKKDKEKKHSKKVKKKKRDNRHTDSDDSSTQSPQDERPYGPAPSLPTVCPW